MECVICLENEAVKLPCCNAGLHYTCFREYLKFHQQDIVSCPHCRGLITPIIMTTRNGENILMPSLIEDQLAAEDPNLVVSTDPAIYYDDEIGEMVVEESTTVRFLTIPNARVTIVNGRVTGVEWIPDDM